VKKWIFIISFIGNFLLDIADTNAQQWIRIFNGDTNFMGDRIIEYYDKGYLIAGDKETSPIYFDGWLCKLTLMDIVYGISLFRNPIPWLRLLIPV